ncbi:hypothetical protein GQ600_14297 [Phytophthora cactorum]|nr:hypothetical protein GQ600_14297 [Phytophthora cactorum]
MQFELIHCSTEVLDAGNIKVEGSTSFPSAPARFYRYAIALKDSKLSIWMEDRRAKSSGVAIKEVSSPFQTIIRMSFPVRGRTHEDRALESKLREQQEKLDILEVAETTSTSLAEFTSTLKFGENGKIRGVGHGSNEVVTNCYNGVLHVRRDGVYLVEAAVKCVGCATSDEDDEDDTDDTNEGDDDVDEIDSGDDEDKFVSLLKNGECIRMDYFSESAALHPRWQSRV